MNSNENSKTDLLIWLKNASSSIIIHVIGFILITVLAKLSLNSSVINPVFYTVEFNEVINSDNIVKQKDLIEKEPDDFSNPEEISSAQQFIFADINADTTNLDQFYREQSLNVSIRFPKGWTFVDQNVKNKLDGVTFWASDGTYNSPPYIHLEVKEKYYFNEQRYIYKMEFDNYTAYYNDPEIIEGHVLQTVYLRTETDEDFSLKLMMVGEEAFKSFQPRFFGMIKTFNFGSSFL